MAMIFSKFKASRITPSILTSLVVLLLSSGASADDGEMRALWADAWSVGFHNQDQVDALVESARANNFNAIIVQMRRRGDAFYMPRAPNGDPRTTAIDEDFDALAALIDAAHNGSRRIEVHCWVTAFPVWSDEDPPAQPGHIYNQHPEFLMENSSGETFLSEGYYVDPGHPEAMRWTARMAEDIVSRYDIDGFHWDYIRYPRQDSGYNPTAVARFNEEFGLNGKPAPNDRRFSDWRRRQVGDFLRWVNAGLLEIRPDLIISAAVFGERSSAFNHFQDWSSWNAQGMIDLCLPMGYTSNNAVFMNRANDSLSHQGERRVYVGQGSFLNSPENTLMQLSYARSQGALGTVLYSYRVPRSGEMNADIREQTLAYVRDHFQPTWKETPPLPWKTATGIAKGRVVDGETGETVYNAHVSIDAGAGFSQRSCVQGGYAFFNVTGGSWTVTASAEGRIARETVTVTPGGVAHVDLVLRDREPSDPPETILLTNFEDVNAGPDDGTVLFRQPSYSGATLPNLQLSPNSARITREAPAGIDGEQSLRVDFAFNPGLDNPWLRLSTHRAIRFPNPVLRLDRGFRFDLHSNQDAYVAVGIRDNGATGLIGSFGGDSGTIEWVGGITDNEREGLPGNVVPPLGRLVKAGEWTTLHFQLPDEPVKAFNGTGELTHSQGVFEHIAIVPVIAEDGTYSTDPYAVHFDNFAVTDEPPGNANHESGTAWRLDASEDDPEQNLRTWTALDGRTLRAELLDSDETSITVRRDYDGRVFTISFDDLSEGDREFVADQGSASPSPDNAVLALLPGSEPPETILAIRVEQMSEAERLAAVSLQGLAADSSTGVFLLFGTTQTLWLSLLEETGVRVEHIEGLDELASRVSEATGVKEFIRTRIGGDDLNAATSLAGVRRAALIDEELVARAECWGWQEILDARPLDDSASWLAGQDQYARHVVFQQKPDKWHLRDIIIASRGFVYWDAPPGLLRQVSRHAGANTPLLGWGPDHEETHVGTASAAGFRTIASDWSLNLSVMSRFKIESLAQKLGEPAPPGDRAVDVHYVAFVMSDGDNIQWILGSEFAEEPKYWASEIRGSFPMGWQLAPGLIDAAPIQMQWLYQDARQDEFVMGVSGTGYFFPTTFSPAALRLQAEQIGHAIARTDMPIVTILDHAPLRSTAFRNAAATYASAPGFKGGIYLNYADYAGGNGDGIWVRDKPFIAARFKLWDSDPVELAQRINAQSRDPSSFSGYSFISVHPWSHTLRDVQTVVDNLDPHVRVVLPSKLFERVQSNVRP